MGFTGQKAAQWKEKFLTAFNWQSAEIARLRTLQAAPEWTAARIEGKTARRNDSHVIKTFVEYAKSQGSKSAGKYYLVISKETNRSLFFVESAVGAGFRDGLTSAQLACVAMAERIVERALLEAMASKMFYRDGHDVQIGVYSLTTSDRRKISARLSKRQSGFIDSTLAGLIAFAAVVMLLIAGGL